MMNRFLDHNTKTLLEVSVQHLSETLCYRLAKQDGFYKAYKQITLDENHGKFMEVAVIFKEEYVERRDNDEKRGFFYHISEHLERREEKAAFAFVSKRFIEFLENEHMEG